MPGALADAVGARVEADERGQDDVGRELLGAGGGLAEAERPATSAHRCPTRGSASASRGRRHGAGRSRSRASTRGARERGGIGLAADRDIAGDGQAGAEAARRTRREAIAIARSAERVARAARACARASWPCRSWGRVAGPPWPFAGLSTDARYVRWGPCASDQGPGRDSPHWMMNSLRDNKGSYRAEPAIAYLGARRRLLKGVGERFEPVGDPRRARLADRGAGGRAASAASSRSSASISATNSIARSVPAPPAARRAVGPALVEHRAEHSTRGSSPSRQATACGAAADLERHLGHQPALPRAMTSSSAATASAIRAFSAAWRAASASPRWSRARRSPPRSARSRRRSGRRRAGCRVMASRSD